jgi:uncharacterized protein YjbJ (UPF0337 family)
MDSNTGPEAGIEGVVEDLKGKAKEVGGTVTNNEELKREGQVQQEKAEANRDVARKEAEADAARARAQAKEAEQRTHQ